MNEVVEFKSRKKITSEDNSVETKNPSVEVNQNALEIVEKLLEAVKSGDVKSVALVYAREGGKISSNSYAIDKGNSDFHSIVAGLNYLSHHLISTANSEVGA